MIIRQQKKCSQQLVCHCPQQHAKGRQSQFQSPMLLRPRLELEVQAGICLWLPAISVVGAAMRLLPGLLNLYLAVKKKQNKFKKIPVFPAVRRGWTGFPQEFLCVLIPTSISFMQL